MLAVPQCRPNLGHAENETLEAADRFTSAFHSRVLSLSEQGWVLVLWKILTLKYLFFFAHKSANDGGKTFSKSEVSIFII